jgi:hypothetical protein
MATLMRNGKLSTALVILATIFDCLALPAQSGAGETAVSEYEVKAALLFNFIRFTRWPSESASEPLHVCVLGGDPFGSTLDNALAGKVVRDRRIELRRLQRVEAAEGCHVVFISAGEKDHVGQLLSDPRLRTALTVSDIPKFAEHGGIIDMRLENNRVRFDVNLGAATRSGLVISSQLLKLAHIVGDDKS